MIPTEDQYPLGVKPENPYRGMPVDKLMEIRDQIFERSLERTATGEVWYVGRIDWDEVDLIWDALEEARANAQSVP